MSQKDLVFQLERAIEEELRLHQALYDLVVREKELLIAADVAELSESNNLRDALLAKLRKLAEHRNLIARTLAHDLGILSESPRLLDLIGKMEIDSAKKLKQQHEVFDLLVKRIQEQHHENAQLAESALQNVQGALKDIKGSLSDKGTYKRQGGIQNAPTAGQFVSKEA